MHADSCPTRSKHYHMPHTHMAMAVCCEPTTWPLARNHPYRRHTPYPLGYDKSGYDKYSYSRDGYDVDGQYQ